MNPISTKQEKIKSITAEWIDRGDFAECSECGGESGTQFDGVQPIPLKTKFCAHCGRRMTETRKEI